jgi:hypothetical protein
LCKHDKNNNTIEAGTKGPTSSLLSCRLQRQPILAEYADLGVELPREWVGDVLGKQIYKV